MSTTTLDVHSMMLSIRAVSERPFDVMIAALNKYYQSNKFIHVLSDEELTAIPKEVFLWLLSTHIGDVWDRLPH